MAIENSVSNNFCSMFVHSINIFNCCLSSVLWKQAILIPENLTTVKCSKLLNTFLFLFSNIMLFFKAESQKMLVKIANRKDPDQTASSEAVCYVSALFRPFWQATSVQNFRIFTVGGLRKNYACFLKW